MKGSIKSWIKPYIIFYEEYNFFYNSRREYLIKCIISFIKDVDCTS